MWPIRALIGGRIDYAGLFQPAGLPMDQAVRSYVEHRDGPDGWALARFVLPTIRLEEFARCAGRFRGPWHLSMITGKPHDSEITVGAARVEMFREVALDDHIEEIVQFLAAEGLQAKVRTGGLTEERIPSTANLARFIVACVTAGVPFKATAGLHHPIRCVSVLTYETGSPSAKMHGFLNVLLAATFVKDGMKLDDAVRVLEEESPEAFRFEKEAVKWRSFRAGLDALRNCPAVSFGSCSFEEPIADLKAMGLL